MSEEVKTEDKKVNLWFFSNGRENDPDGVSVSEHEAKEAVKMFYSRDGSNGYTGLWKSSDDSMVMYLGNVYMVRWNEIEETNEDDSLGTNSFEDLDYDEFDEEERYELEHGRSTEN